MKNAPSTPPGTPALPPSLAVAWGLTEAPSRGPRPGMTAAAIVRAAIELADADGIGAASMGRVAERLGYTPMSLYRYVPSKDALVMLMFDAVLEPLPPRERGRGWRSGLERWTRELSAVYDRHPWLVDIPITGPPAMPNHLAWLDWGLGELEPSGLGAAERLSVMLLVSGYVRNVAQLERDLTAGRQRAGTTPPEVAERYQELLEHLVTRERFPSLHDALHQGLLTDGGAEDDLEFEFGLQRILDGIEALVSARRTRASRRESRAASRTTRR